MDHPIPDTLYGLYGQVNRLHYSRMHVLLEKMAVYPGQPPLLFALGRQDGQSQKELAEKMRLKPATVTVMLNRMERSGLVERRADPDDQRVSRVYLTGKGQVVLGEAKAAMKVIEEELFANFTDEEKMLLRRLFIQMRDNLQKNSEIYPG